MFPNFNESQSVKSVHFDDLIGHLSDSLLRADSFTSSAILTAFLGNVGNIVHHFLCHGALLN